MKSKAEMISARNVPNSLLGDDYHFKPCIYGSAEQQLCTLVMRDMLDWFLGVEPGSGNINTNLIRLSALAARVKEYEAARGE